MVGLIGCSVVGSLVLFYSSSSARNSSIENTCLVAWSHFEEAYRYFASVVNIFMYHESVVSHRKGIRPAIIGLASESFSGKNVNVKPFSDLHCLLIVWNKGVPGNTCEGIDRII